MIVKLFYCALTGSQTGYWEMAKNFVIVHSAFGYDMFIAITKCDVSDKVEGALVFDYSKDNPEVKVAAYARSTGFDGWYARAI